MRSLVFLAMVWAGLQAAPAPASAAADPVFDEGALVANGNLSRRLWRPDFASAEAGGVHYSLGLALGLRGPVRDSLSRPATPALVLAWRDRASVALLPAGGRGAMLVWMQALH